MSKHTPGPWEFVTRADKTGFWIDSPKTKEQPHGRVADVAQYSYDWAGPMRAEALANARLISAAPDLLEALTLLVAGIENSVSDTYIPLVKAREAIAKATRESK